MEHPLKRPIYHEQLAQLCRLSPSRFHAVFRDIPGGYLQDLRLRKAQSLLLSTGEAVKTVAARVGYPDEFHFSRLFRKRFGQAPSAFRERSRHLIM